MKKTILKGIGFLILLVSLVAGNMFVFRSDLPLLWFITLLISIVAILFFPYKLYFNIKNQKN